MSNYFPTELLSEILVKLPVKTLIRFTAVSKSWRSIITSAAFIASHLSTNSKNQTVLLTRYGLDNKLDQFSLLEVSENGGFGINSSMVLEAPFGFQIEYSRVVGYCDGLVCLSNCMFFRNPSQRGIIIWNPSARYSTVLVVVFRRRSRYFPDTWSWRRLIRGVDVALRAYSNVYRRAFLYGVVHWLAKEPIHDRSSVLAFDIGDEVFGEVMLPDELATGASVELGVFVIEESLGIVGSTNELCDVWVMKEYRVKESWTKLYKIDLAEEIKNLVGFWKNGEALLMLRDLWLVVYNPETKETKDLGFYGNPYSSYVDIYVESLLLW
ncbi:PREDICTED: F-box/kelch-repeat protein At3g06240-like [Erythranthe guttata]|uniref:F-box/kelch-repeat protein At3g06240-like n=1 Tax=Erythranthe guttata TaxID=4155 RepID=UPI00064DBF52|nr:PREDICTED: F-box/kelch-repeat protein At3g06240-like [Erythranthe guttata]|eukprot:XP_012852404.1 PREDICTED: F-box/kelch-repeat protein At3g06240-like [Erythranthe guttata]